MKLHRESIESQCSVRVLDKEQGEHFSWDCQRLVLRPSALNYSLSLHSCHMNLLKSTLLAPLQGPLASEGPFWWFYLDYQMRSLGMLIWCYHCFHFSTRLKMVLVLPDLWWLWFLGEAGSLCLLPSDQDSPFIRLGMCAFRCLEKPLHRAQFCIIIEIISWNIWPLDMWADSHHVPPSFLSAFVCRRQGEQG